MEILQYLAHLSGILLKCEVLQLLLTSALEHACGLAACPSLCKQALLCYLLQILSLFHISLFSLFRLLSAMSCTTPSETTKMSRAGSFVSSSSGHPREGKATGLVKPWTWDLIRGKWKLKNTLAKICEISKLRLWLFHISVWCNYSMGCAYIDAVFQRRNKKGYTELISNVSCDTCLKHLWLWW